MARVGISQPSFSAGELTPRLFGRTDFNRYGAGAEAIENFVVRPEGGLIRRHGTRFGGETKASATKSILIPFIVSTIQAYMLEFGNQYIRVWKNNTPLAASVKAVTGGITSANPAVVTSAAHGFQNGDRVIITGVVGLGILNNREFIVANRAANTFQLQGVSTLGLGPYVSGGVITQPLEIASPYLEADLPTLFTTQSADTLYIVHGSYAPRTLVRITDATWTLALTNLSKGPWTTLNTDLNKNVMLTGSGNEAGEAITINASAAIFEAGHAGSYMYIEEIHFADRDVTPYGGERIECVNPGVGDQYSNAGNVYECIQSVGDQLACAVPPVHTSGEAWDAPKGSIDKALWRYLHSRWCIVSLDAFVNSTTMTGTCITYKPTGLTPQAKSVTGAVAGAGGVIRLTVAGHAYSSGDWVAVSGVGGVPNATGNFKIQNVGSTTFELVGSVFAGAFTSGGSVTRWATFLYRLGAFSNARGWPRTVAIHEQRLCYANTNVQPFGFWASKAGDYQNHMLLKEEDDEAIAYNIAGNQVDPIRWMMSSSNIILGTLSGELSAYGGGQGDPITPSNTRIVPQSGEGSNATPPTKVGGIIMFANRAGRKLFSLDYRTEADQYLATDELELAAHLTLGRTIVRMAWAKNPLSVLWICLSDGLLCSMTYRKEQQIIAWARHPTAGIVENIAVIPSPDGTVDDLWMITRRTIGGVTKRYVEILARPFEPTTPTDKATMGFVDCALNYNGAPASTLTGLFYLEGQTLQVVADGARHPDRVVANGQITLQSPAANVWAGLGYRSRLRTLRPENAAQVTAQGKTKRSPRVTVRVMNALAGKCGPYDESVMDDIVPASIADPAVQGSAMFTGDRDVFLASEYDLDARLSFIQDEPMPLDVLSIMPLLTVSEG